MLNTKSARAWSTNGSDPLSRRREFPAQRSFPPSDAKGASEPPKGFPHVRGVILLLLAAGIALPSVPVLGGDADQRTDATGRRLPGNCQLPVTIRKFSEGQTFPLPGNVIRTSRQDCMVRGGTYLPAPPEPAAAKPK